MVRNENSRVGFGRSRARLGSGEEQGYSDGVKQGWVRDEKSMVQGCVKFYFPPPPVMVGFGRSRAGLGSEGVEQGWVREEMSRVGLGRRRAWLG